jgi:hypothetical protein
MIALLLALAAAPALLTLTADFDGDGLADKATFERVAVKNAFRGDKIYGIVVRRGATPEEKQILGLTTHVEGLKFEAASLRTDCPVGPRTIPAPCVSTGGDALNAFIAYQDDQPPHLYYWTGRDFAGKDLVP